MTRRADFWNFAWQESVTRARAPNRPHLSSSSLPISTGSFSASKAQIHVWHLPPPAFTVVFLWSSVGITVGTLCAGPIGDRFGRQPPVLASLTIFGLASLLSAGAGSLGVLSLSRFFTELGIGGVFASAPRWLAIMPHTGCAPR